MPISLERKLPFILLFVFLMMLTVGYVSFRSTVQTQNAVVWERHTLEVLIHLDEALLTVVDVETGMRGFIISGDQRYLDPYEDGKKNYSEELEKLRALLIDNSAQLERLDKLDELVKVRFADADKKVSTRRANSLEQTLALFQSAEGLTTMNNIRGVLKELKDEEVRLLEQRERDLNSSIYIAKLTVIGTSVVGLLTLILAYVVVLFEVKKRRKAELGIVEANKRLEQRVEARTAELAAANASLAESEFFKRAVIDSLPAHIAVLDREGKIVMVNEAWEKFAGDNTQTYKQLGEVGVGQNYLTVCTGDPDNADIQGIYRDLKEILEGKKQAFTVEYPCHSDTEERWFLMQANALHAATGGIVISHYNITARVKAEQSVKLSEEFNRSIVENSPDCVKVLTLDGKMVSMNYPGMCLMEIDDLSQIEGKPWTDNWTGDGNASAAGAVEKARAGETAFFEGFCATAKGTPKWWEVSVAPVLNELGKPHRILVVSREISERKKAEEERERILENEKLARREAEVANRLRDEFMATVSHELRTPLNSILGWARLLKSGVLDEEKATKAVETIIKSSEAQNRLIEDLLDVARLISGKLELDISRVSPVDLVSNAVETVRPMADAKDISLGLKMSEEAAGLEISGDQNRLQQIVLNLMTNAIKFTPEGGSIAVELYPVDSGIEIRVSDKGIGISPQFLPYVFERFQQDSSNVEKRSGLGLGLAIVRHLVELHGGSVRAHSEGENRGSEFTVSLPLAS